MTIEELNQLKNLRKEIEEQERRKRNLRKEAVALSGTSESTSKSYTGDKLGKIVTEIAALEEQINKELTEYWRKYVELEMYIANIPDSLTRRIFRMRFIDGKTWEAIAWKCGGKNTADGIRKRCERFVENN